MAFPATPLPVLVGIAPGANPTSASTLNFTDITGDVRVATGVQIQAGRQDEGSGVDTTRVQTVLDNRSGNYSRVNPLSPFYGALSRGTPISVSVVRIIDSFTRTTSNGWGVEPNSGFNWAHTSASFWSTNGSAGQCVLATANTAAVAVHTSNLSGADDVEVFHTASLSAVATGAPWVSAAMVRYSDVNNHYRMHLEFGLSGAVGVKISKTVGGVLTSITAVVPTGDTYSAGTQVRMRARAIGPTLQVRAWLAANAEPTTWQVQVDDSDLTGQGVGLYEWRVAGNTNAGTLTVTVDDFRADNIRAITPVPEWPVRWDQSGRDVTAPITGAGIMRRLSQGQAALRSPMARQIGSYASLLGYWRLEDSSGSQSLANDLPGAPAGNFSGSVSFDADAAAGASASVQLGSDGYIAGAFATSSASGWQFCWVQKLSATPATSTPIAMMQWSDTLGRMWYWRVSNTGYQVEIGAPGGSSLSVSNVGFGAGLDPTRWTRYRMRVTVSGGTLTYEPAWYEQDAGFISGITGNFSATATGQPSVWQSVANVHTNGASYGHVFAVTDTTLNLTSSYDAVNSFNGYRRERAGDRLRRLSSENGVPLRIFGSTAVTAQMGVQKPGTYLELARECEDADQGVITEAGAGLGYLTHRSRLNGPAVMVLDFASGHVAEPPEPVDDDQRLRNRVTLTRTSGSSVTVQDGAGIAQDGVYADELTVNLADDTQLPNHAGWRLHLGSLDDLRWPRITLQLHRNPSLIASWCKVRIGSRITIANPPAAVAGASLDLIVEGWTETLSAFSWDVTLVCSPASSWKVGAWDATTSRWDLRTSSMNATVAAGVTTLVFKQTDNETWATTGTPYNLLIAGELVTVTAMGARSGTGPWTQTATVTRAVNGIAKTLLAAAPVHVATPGRWAI